jgi:hypothetical protein
MNQSTANTFSTAGPAHEVSSQASTGAWILLISGIAAGSILIIYLSTHTPTYPIDSYFYLSKAQQFVAGKGLTISWNDGVDPKYFPGYSLVVAISLALGGSFVPVQLFAYLLSAALLVLGLKELRRSSIEQALAASAFSVNPIVIKWYSLPMAEGCALALSLAAVFFFLRFIRTKSYRLLFPACVLGGFAVVTRMEAIFLLFIFVPMLYRERRTLKIGSIAAGAALFFLPLVVYFGGVRNSAGEGQAYVSEFGYTLAKFNLLKNFLYNIWIPFGLMQRWPLRHSAIGLAAAGIHAAGFVWVVIGEMVFLAGVLYALTGRPGPTVRAAALLFLLYAGLHALWYYRYERFMLLALPLAAFIWAGSIHFFIGRIHAKKGEQVLLPAQAMLVVAGLALAYVFGSTHAELLQRDTFRLPFREVAKAVNEVNESGRPILTDLGPHLAYYLNAHSYMDDDHGNYWQRAFPPERTVEELNKLGIRLIVTRWNFSQWMAEHRIPPEKTPNFEEVPSAAKDVTIIKYARPE